MCEPFYTILGLLLRVWAFGYRTITGGATDCPSSSDGLGFGVVGGLLLYDTCILDSFQRNKYHKFCSLLHLNFVCVLPGKICACFKDMALLG